MMANDEADDIEINMSKFKLSRFHNISINITPYIPIYCKGK